MTDTAPQTTFKTPELTDADNNHTGSSPPSTSQRRRMNRKWLIGGGVVAAAAIGYVVFGGGGSSNQAEPVTGPINTAEVVVADLVQEVSFDGTLGTVATDPIVAATNGVATAVASPGDTVAQGDILYRIDNEPVVLLYGDTPAYRDITLGSETMGVAAAGSGVVTGLAPAGAIIEQGDILYWVDGEPVVALYGTTPMYRTLRDLSTDLVGEDVAQLETALSELGFTLDESLTIDDQFTYGTQLAVQAWQESLGVEIDGIIEPGDVVFIPGPSQIVEYAVEVGANVSPGAAVGTLSTGFPLSGDDVAQVEASLAEMGFDAGGEMDVDGVFTAETREAVVEFQTSVGQRPDGVVNLGDIVFLPTSAKIAEQLAAPGATLNAGAPVVSLTSIEQVVRVDVPAADQGLIDIGDQVTVILPGFVEAPGTVVTISTTAEVTQDGETFFEAIVALDDPAAAEGLDEAPVTIDVVGDSVTGVTAVPVTALIALAEGGYAVEVDTGAGYQLVAVEPGFFADGLVQVTSESLTVGDTVTLP